MRPEPQSLAVSFRSEMIAGVQLSPVVSAVQLTDQLVCWFATLKKSGEAQILGVAADLDLSFSQLRALFVLSDHQEELAVHELAQHLGMSMATAGRAVQGLARVDMVTRREDEQDRRVKRVGLSEHGRAFVTGLVQAHRAAVLECVESLSDEERGQLSQALTPILTRSNLSTTTFGC